MFPSDWADRKGASASTKRRRVQQKEESQALMAECESVLAMDTSSALTDGNEEYDSIVNVIKRQINDNKFLPHTPEEIQLDHVLSSIPYQSLLESLFGNVSGPAPDVPIVSKIYEESFMREPLPGDRPCVMGERCECMFIDKNAPFVGTEFILPGEATTAKDEPRMCVLCCRKTTQKLFYDICYSGKKVNGVIQRYGNLCNQPGEYARECMLICPSNSQWQGMPLPIMSHQRNRYCVSVMAGIKYLRQLRVSYENFFVSPLEE
jgi:hypothetical protein